jgi:hypothetical protein
MLFRHLERIGVAPLSLALPWIRAAFSMHLEIKQVTLWSSGVDFIVSSSFHSVIPVLLCCCCLQVLLLWDRILAFDSLELLPLLAVAILLFRCDTIMESQAGDDVRFVCAV